MMDPGERPVFTLPHYRLLEGELKKGEFKWRLQWREGKDKPWRSFAMNGLFLMELGKAVRKGPLGNDEE